MYIKKCPTWRTDFFIDCQGRALKRLRNYVVSTELDFRAQYCSECALNCNVYRIVLFGNNTPNQTTFYAQDFNCFITQPLARLGAEVTGVDASALNIHVALRHARHDPMVEHRVRYKCTTVEELADEEPESFDCVVASEVIEHVTDKDTFISASTQLIKVIKLS